MARTNKFEQIFQCLAAESEQEINQRVITRDIKAHPDYDGSDFFISRIGEYPANISALGNDYVSGKIIISVTNLSDEQGLIAKEIIENHRVVGGGPVFDDEVEEVQINEARDLFKQISSGTVVGNNSFQRATILYARVLAYSNGDDHTTIQTPQDARDYWFNFPSRVAINNGSTATQIKNAVLDMFDKTTEANIRIFQMLILLDRVSDVA